MQLVSTRAYQAMLLQMRRIIGTEYNMSQLRFNVACIEYDAMNGKIVRPYTQREWEQAIAIEYYNNLCELDKRSLRRVFIRPSHLRSELVNGSTTATKACVPDRVQTRPQASWVNLNDKAKVQDVQHRQLLNLRPY